MTQLRPYQIDCRDGVLNAWSQGHRNVLLTLPTGGGKTVIFSDIIAREPGASVAIAHRQELVVQISLALARNGVRHRIVGPKAVAHTCTTQHLAELRRNYVDPGNRVAVAGVDTLVRMEPNAWTQSVSLVVQDECFIAGTLIDGRPIEDVRVGDTVTAFNEVSGEFVERKVVRLFKKAQPKRMVRIRITHHELNCTPNHPFFTKRGWIRADELERTDEVLFDELFYLRGARHSERTIDGFLREDGSGVLLSGMLYGIPKKDFIRNCDEDKSGICVRPHAQEKSNARSEIGIKNDEPSTGDWAQAESSRGEWKTSNFGRRNFVDHVFRVGFCASTEHSDRTHNRGRERFPASVQAGYGELETEASAGGGRFDAFRERFIERCEKGEVFKWTGLDDVEIYEHRNIGTPGGCGEGGYVYNFEVDEHHTYVANGIVVHNCHHVLKKNKWGAAASMFPQARMLGVTATPCRADGNGLGRHADGLMDTMVQGPTMRELIADGYLTEYRIFAPPSDIDLRDVPLSASGDFSPPKLAHAVHKSHIVGDVVQHYQRIAPGKLGITFTVDVESATEMAAAFRHHGIPAEMVSAKTPDGLRRSILQRLRRRELLQVVNVDLFGEGFDLPAIEVISMARPTQSYGLFCQQFGRSLRPMEGKLHAIIIDHVGNVHRHGLPDAPRVWTLDRRERRTSATVEQVIPVRTCPECTGAYERVLATCPYCGFAPEPAGRSLPEEVDGDLYELTPEALAKLRGEIDAPPAFHPDKLIQASLKARHRERQEAQAQLREAMALWGGQRTAQGDTISMAQRRFYFKYGIDIGTAQTLGRKEADELKQRIEL